MDPTTVTLVIDHGHAVAPGPDPVAQAVLHAVAVGITGWSSLRIAWHLGRRRARSRAA